MNDDEQDRESWWPVVIAMLGAGLPVAIILSLIWVVIEIAFLFRH